MAEPNNINNNTQVSELDQQIDWGRALGEERKRKIQKGAEFVHQGTRLANTAAKISGYKSKGLDRLGNLSVAAGAMADDKGGVGVVGDVAKSAAKQKIVNAIVKRFGLGAPVAYLNIIKEAKFLANSLNESIEKGLRTPWIIVLLAAIVKDLIDLGLFITVMSSLGITIPFDFLDSGIDLAMSMFWFLFLWGRGTILFKFLIKRVGFLPLFEAIPVLGALPVYTTTVIYTYFKTKKKIASMEEELEEINNVLRDTNKALENFYKIREKELKKINKEAQLSK